MRLIYNGDDVYDENHEIQSIKNTIGTGTLDTDEKTIIPAINELKSNLTDNLTFTPSSGVTVTYEALGAFNGVAYGSIECQVTAAANNWVTLGSFDINPPQAITVPVVRTGDGTYCGMVNISSNNNVRLYSKQALSNNAIAFTFVFAYNPT